MWKSRMASLEGVIDKLEASSQIEVVELFPFLLDTLLSDTNSHYRPCCSICNGIT